MHEVSELEGLLESLKEQVSVLLGTNLDDKMLGGGGGETVHCTGRVSTK